MNSHQSQMTRNMALGFYGSRETSCPMGYYQSHNEIEINFATNAFDYFIGGKTIRIPPQRLVIFWALNPHEITWTETKSGHHFHITIPLPWFLNWQLPAYLIRRILAGEVLIESDEKQCGTDQHLVEKWCEDLASNDATLHSAVLFEVQGRLLRFASSFRQSATQNSDQSNLKQTTDNLMEKVAIMAKYVAEHGHEAINVSDIANTAKLHPNYATTLFHETCGVSLIKFLITHRITLAQILLASTTKKIITIAFECGFNSVSQFYSHFKEFNKITPSQYRIDRARKNMSHLAKHHKSAEDATI